MPQTTVQTTSELIDRAELSVGAEIDRELTDYLAVARAVVDEGGLLIEQVQHADGEPRAIHACAFLIARLLTDLRAVMALLRTGYVAPALSLTAGMLEMSFTSIYIGADEERAALWLAHADTANATPWGVYDMIAEVSRQFEQPDTLTRREWDTVYRQACMVKHGNPMALEALGLVQDERGAFVLTGPFMSKSIRRAAHGSLANAVRYTKLAALKFLRDHVPQSAERDRIVARWKSITEIQHRLVKADMQEFGGIDRHGNRVGGGGVGEGPTIAP